MKLLITSGLLVAFSFLGLGCDGYRTLPVLNGVSISTISYDKVNFSSKNSVEEEAYPKMIFDSSMQLDFSTEPATVTAFLSSTKNGPAQCQLNFDLSYEQAEILANLIKKLSLCSPEESEGGIGIGFIGRGPDGSEGPLEGIETYSGNTRRLFLDGYLGTEKVFRGIRVIDPFSNIPLVCGDSSALKNQIKALLEAHIDPSCPDNLGGLL